MIKKGLCIGSIFFLTACAIKPAYITLDDRYTQAQADVQELFSPQMKFPKKLDYYEALARSLKYNLDYRIKLVNTALQAGQLGTAEFTMFPALNASGSIYTRNNDMSSFGATLQGSPTDTLNSTPRTLRTSRIVLSWNVLDFGLGYVRAKQQSERVLIAEQEAHKQAQTLAQDVLVAYWDAYNAQELIKETLTFQKLLADSKKRLSLAVNDKLIPQENILNYEATLLEGSRRLMQLDYKYHKAIIDLRHLLNLPPDQAFILTAPPVALLTPQNINKLSLEKLDAITLVKRPELYSQAYQGKIAELGVTTTLLQALPGITFNDGWNYNSNKFLINQKWLDRSMDLAWNLLNLASLPTDYHAAKTQVKYEKLKRMALTVAVLTETRYAFWHYKSLSAELDIAKKQTHNAEALYTLRNNRALASIDSDQDVILAKLHVLTTKMEQQLLQSDLSTALGEIYLSSGTDILPITVGDESIPELTEKIRMSFVLERKLSFADYVNTTYETIFRQKPPTPKIAVVSTKIIKPAVNAVTQNTAIQAYTVQVFGSYHLNDLKSVARELDLPKNLNIGRAKFNGKDWYVLTVGQFKTFQDAKASVSTLSKKGKLSAAWVRPTTDVKWLA